MLDVHRTELATDDLHRIGNALCLHFALRALLPFDLDLRVLAFEFLRRGELARNRIRHFVGVLHVADDDALDDERAALCVHAYTSEDGVADRHQRFLYCQTVAPLYFVARERAQRLAHEVRVGNLHDRIWIPLERGVGDSRAVALHEQRYLRRINAPDGVHAKRDLEIVTTQHRIVAGE